MIDSTSLTTQKQLDLLNDIDKLRSYGVSQYVNLPQLIVCGDQSSGKSSALEAISGIPFPTKDNLCTRFATEVILRHAQFAAISVTIVPGSGRSNEEAEQIRGFKRALHDLTDFPDLINDAKVHMGVETGLHAFSTDVLRIEVTGPEQPHLTIVDLPGLIHSANKHQSADDVEIVQDMVFKYMGNRRSIILAVVSAKNDHANQIVLKLARQVDPAGTRTLGLITKPDTLSSGSESETTFIHLAQNLDIIFRLGWHVLRNRSYEERDLAQNARDESERTFFERNGWNDLPKDIVGIHSLRGRLSSILFEQIRSELPALIDDIENEIKQAKGMLHKLGAPRVGLEHEKRFLLNASQKFQTLCKAALDGLYEDHFFGAARSEAGTAKRLRAVVQNLNIDFARLMRRHIKSRSLLDYKSRSSDEVRPERKNVSRAAYLEHIHELLVVTRGRELPGMFNPNIVADLFRDQSSLWEENAEKHIFRVWLAARAFLELLTCSLAEESVSESLISYVLDPALEEALKCMKRELRRILRPFQTGTLITYNHYFTDNVQKARADRQKQDIAKKLAVFLQDNKSSIKPGAKVQDANALALISALGSSTMADMDNYACREILDCMEAFLKVAMKTVVDNIAIYVIQETLLDNLSEVFSPSSVLQMDPELTSRIAAEPRHITVQREQTQDKVNRLEAGLQVCKVHAARRPIIGASRSDKHSDSWIEQLNGTTDGEVAHDADSDEMIDSDLGSDRASDEEGFDMNFSGAPEIPETLRFTENTPADTDALAVETSTAWDPDGCSWLHPSDPFGAPAPSAPSAFALPPPVTSKNQPASKKKKNAAK